MCLYQVKGQMFVREGERGTATPECHVDGEFGRILEQGNLNYLQHTKQFQENVEYFQRGLIKRSFRVMGTHA